MLKQSEVDTLGKRVAKLIEKYSKDASQLEPVKLAWEKFTQNLEVEAFVIVENEVKKVEDYSEPDMTPVFMNI